MSKKRKYPMAFKVRVLQLWKQEKMKPRDAFAQARDEYSIEGSGCQKGSNASSHIRDYEMEIKAKLWDHDEEVWQLCITAKLFDADWMVARGFHQHVKMLEGIRDGRIQPGDVRSPRTYAPG